MAQPPLGRIQPYRGCCPPPYSIILLRARGSQEPGVCWQQDPGWRGTCADGSLIADKAEAAVEIAAIVLSTLRVPLLSIQSRGNICDTIQREKKKIAPSRLELLDRYEDGIPKVTRICSIWAKRRPTMRPSSGMDLRKNAGVKEESIKLILPCISTSRYCHGVSFRLFFPFTTMPDWTDCISMSDVTCFTSAAVPRAAFCMRICRFLAAKKVQNSSRQSVNVYHRERGRKICIYIGGFFILVLILLLISMFNRGIEPCLEGSHLCLTEVIIIHRSPEHIDRLALLCRL